MGGLFQKKIPEPPVFAGDPLLPAVYGKFVKGDFSLAQRLLALEPAELRYFYAFQLAEKLTRVQVLAWGTGTPEALLLRAAHGPQWAWEARSDQPARELSQQQKQGFGERLAVVQQEVEALPESDPNRWALMLIVAKGKNMPLLESERLYGRISQEHYFGACNYLECQLKKWGGSHPRALDFARGLAERSREGSLMGAVVASALTEQWLFSSAFDKNQAEAQQVLTDPELLKLSLNAYQRSLGSARFVETPCAVEARNAQAFWFYLSKQREPLQQELQKLGKRFTQYPWCYLGPPGKVYREAQQFARRP